MVAKAINQIHLVVGRIIVDSVGFAHVHWTNISLQQSCSPSCSTLVGVGEFIECVCVWGGGGGV